MSFERIAPFAIKPESLPRLSAVVFIAGDDFDDTFEAAEKSRHILAEIDQDLGFHLGRRIKADHDGGFGADVIRGLTVRNKSAVAKYP